ncbi:MAG: hydantoinase/oxoprolinase family protein [Betaproteobacteria bacterium]|nr:hydantoinase/oxoprolinase family protein [Betaproteobacteria bacterium]
MADSARYKLGVDIGGTFTDLTLIEEGGDGLHTHKIASTPDAPSRAVAQGVSELMRRIGSTPAAINGFVHGTTIALNAILEYRGAKVALLVSTGNRDILEIGRLAKHDTFNLRAAAPSDLLPRRRVLEVTGRIDRHGAEVTPLATAALREQLATLAAGDIDSVAVCFLNGYVSAAHEREAAAVIAEVLPGRHVSLSTELWPEMREYERAMVAVLNAYVQPVLSRYLRWLQRDTVAIGMNTRLYITQSNGGVMSAATAEDKPVRTLLSGPASGVVGAAYIARLVGVQEAVTIDIGGTSADVSLIRDGEPVHSTEAKVGVYPVVMPSVDVFAVGAGGGSIAWFDPVGLLKVGPKSAGAMPGPAAYGNGNTEPTVTDAYIICGYLNPDNFLGGAMKLERALAEAAVKKIADRLEVSLEEAAEAILKIATANMITALLPMMTKRGVDPRDFALIPFGGAGATHACLLAEEIIIPRIVVPPNPGTTCALGAAIADVKNDYIKSLRGDLAKTPAEAIRAGFAELEATGRAWLAAENPVMDNIVIRRSIDARYYGQAFDIEVELPGDSGTLDPQAVAARFHDTYEALYRNSDRKARIDLVNLRVRVSGKTPALTLKRLAKGEGEPQAKGTRRIWYNGAHHEAKLYERTGLFAGQRIAGPAIVEQFDTTTVVAPGFVAITDDYGVLILSRESPDGASHSPAERDRG